MPFAGITLAGIGTAVAGGAAAAAGGLAVNEIAGGLSGGQSAGSNLASGATGIAGGLLSASEAQGLANVASPYNQYAGASASNLANQAAAGNYGQNSTASQNILTNFANNTGAQTNQYIQPTQALAGQAQGATQAAINPAVNAAQQGTAGLNGLNLQGINSQISNLIANPSSIYQTPQYQAAFQQGQGAVNSTLAAQGLNASGNQLAALQSYGQSFGQNAYNTDLTQLLGVSSQAAGQQQQNYGQLSNAAGLGLQANQQAFGQNSAAAQLALQGNQQAYGQLSGANQGALATNNQGFNQLSQLAGVGNNPAAANLLLGQYNAAGSSIGAGIGQLANGASNLLNSSGSPDYGAFNSGLGTSTSGSDISGSGALYGTSAGQSGSDYTYSGSNSYGFTE
jgi:hypothetical protein